MKNRWFLWVLAIAFVWLVVSRYAEIEQLYATLQSGDWPWVLAAALLQVGYYIAYAALHQAALATVEVEFRLWDVLQLVFASLFLNVAAPTAGASGAALFMHDASRRGQSAARTASGMMLMIVAAYTAFTGVLVVGMVYLFVYHHLYSYQIVGAAILLLADLALIAVLLLGVRSTSLLQRLLGATQRLANRLAILLHRSPFLNPEWAERTTLQFSQAAHAITTRPRQVLYTLGVALAVHVVNLCSLYAFFRAFGPAPALGVLIAGYAMGNLFLIVSITPQGIGVVEGIMTLVYTSLGVTPTQATVVVLAFRGLTFWLPLFLGFFLLRRVRAFRGQQRSRAQTWSLRAVAVLTGLMGAVNVVSAVTPPSPDRLAWLSRVAPLAVRIGGYLGVAWMGFALLILTGNLWRRKQAAWQLTILALVLSSVAHLLKGLDIEEGFLCLALVFWLWRLRSHYHAWSDRPSFYHGLAAIANAASFTLVYGMTGFYLLEGHFNDTFGLPAALRHAVLLFLPFDPPGLQPLTGFGRYFIFSVYAVAVGAFGYAAFMLVRPLILRPPASPAEQARARQIIENHGCSSLAWAALLDDKAYTFSPSGETVIPFATCRGAVIALGDPIGPPEDAAAAIAEFCRLSARSRRAPIFYQASPELLPHYRQAGLQATLIGMERVVSLDHFVLDEAVWRQSNAPAAHLAYLGHSARMYYPPHNEDLLDELQAISDDWLAAQHSPERRFSAGWFDDDALESSPVMAVHTPGGEISAFATLTANASEQCATIDLLRCRHQAPNSTAELLVIAAMNWARAQGYTAFNLGISPLANGKSASPNAASEKTLEVLARHIQRFYGERGSVNFQADLHPRGSPRYLIYPPQIGLGQAVQAVLRADTGSSLWDEVMARWRGDNLPPTGQAGSLNA